MAPAKDEIKARLTVPREVVQLFSLDTRGADGREQRQAGGGVFVLCPWHTEKHPSCSLTRGPDGTLRAHCFTCGNGGDVFSLLAAIRGLDLERDFRAILKEAGELAGVNVEAEEQHGGGRPDVPARPPFAPVEPAPIGPCDRAFGALVAPLLHLGRLDGGPCSADVCDYLAGRRLLNLAQREGWTALPPAGSAAAASWARMLQDVAEQIANENDLPAATVEAELRAIVRWDDGRPGFVHGGHRLVIPYRAPCGTIYTWQRRRLDADEPKYVFPSSRDRRWLPCKQCGKTTPHEETGPSRWTCVECPGAEEGPCARAGAGRSARWPHGVERLAGARFDAPVVYTEGALDAATVRALDDAAGRERVVLGVPGTQAWKRGNGYFATFARGRVAFVATDVDAPKPGKAPPGETAAAAWGADLWRANALDVLRIRPPAGSKDWSEALAVSAAGGIAA